MLSGNADSPSLDDLRASLGIYELVRIDPAASAQPALRLIAKWPCGCSARGSDSRSMDHQPCSKHRRVEAKLPFAGDRRKKRS